MTRRFLTAAAGAALTLTATRHLRRFLTRGECCTGCDTPGDH